MGSPAHGRCRGFESALRRRGPPPELGDGESGDERGREAIRTLFPEPVITLTLTGSAAGERADLHPDEAACIARAGVKRRREFAVGRDLARRAFAQLGIEGFALLSDGDRVPRWPEGVVGSISHCAGCCAVVVARRGRILSLGLDVERAERLEDELLARICTPRELERARALPPPAGRRLGQARVQREGERLQVLLPAGPHAARLPGHGDRVQRGRRELQRAPAARGCPGAWRGALLRGARRLDPRFRPRGRRARGGAPPSRP